MKLVTVRPWFRLLLTAAAILAAAALLTTALLTTTVLTRATAEPPRADDAPRAVDTTDFFQHLDRAWSSNPYWFDGNAEVNLYQARLMKYGEASDAETLAHIVVTEKHRPDLLVKADDWHQDGLVDVLKLNYVVGVRTGVYTYQQMLSFFFERESLHLAKMTLTSHEWCGNTYKELVNFRGRSSYDFNTYWDGQGNGAFAVAFPPDLVAYESLPVQLRALAWESGLHTTLHLLAPQLSNKAVEPRWELAELTVTGKEQITVPAGDFPAWAVDLRHTSGQDHLWFEAAFPHRLLRWEAANGDLFELRWSKKMAYWELHGVGDEVALE